LREIPSSTRRGVSDPSHESRSGGSCTDPAAAYHPAEREVPKDAH